MATNVVCYIVNHFVATSTAVNKPKLTVSTSWWVFMTNNNVNSENFGLGYMDSPGPFSTCGSREKAKCQNRNLRNYASNCHGYNNMIYDFRVRNLNKLLKIAYSSIKASKSKMLPIMTNCFRYRIAHVSIISQ